MLSRLAFILLSCYRQRTVIAASETIFTLKQLAVMNTEYKTPGGINIDVYLVVELIGRRIKEV